MLMSTSPLAIQAGTTAEHTVQSRYSMHGAFEVFITGDRVRAEIVPPEIDAEKLKPGEKPQVTSLVLKLTADADAQPGTRDVRIATAQGPSTIGQVVVVHDPVFRESGKNDTAADAPLVALPAALCGAIEKDEDLDCYRFEAAAGSTWTFCVHAARCEDRIHDLQMHIDPILTLRSADGGVLAGSDNEFFADPALSYHFTKAGEYVLEIRDVRYEGNTYWQYCIEAFDRPLVTNVYPLGVTAGSRTTLAPTGLNADHLGAVQWDVPAGLSPGLQFVLPPAWTEQRMNPVPIVVHDLPPALEPSEANDSPADAAELAIPSGVSGRIEREKDVDIYAFEAKKGERFSFEIVARRHGSALDPIIALRNDKGAPLIESDDYTLGRVSSADALIEHWAAPADGKYFFEVRDLHGRGGPAFVYLLKATRSGPWYYLEVDTDKTILSPGTSGVIFVRVVRKNDFAGPIELAIDGLPDGVTASTGRILAGLTEGCIVLTAPEGAQPAAANVRITGAAEIPDDAGQPQRVEVTAAPLQETYMPGGGRGHYPVAMHTVAVAEPLDLLGVEIEPRQLTLVPGGSQRIDVRIRRADGFDKNVTLDVLYRHLNRVDGNPLPPGVTIDENASKLLLTAKESQGHITLTAAKDAKPVAGQQIAVMANVSVNFVMKMTYSSPPCLVTVAEPAVAARE